MVVPVGELEVPGQPPLPTGVPASQIQGRSPWYLAWLRLRRNKVAMVCAAVFVLIVLFCLAAPQNHADSGQKLSEGEGFYQIIIRSGVQAEHAILDRIASS